MGVVTGFFIYFLIWWVMLFTVLPLGVRRHQEGGKGFDAGAPARADMKKKLIINTALSAIVLCVIQILIVTGILDWHATFEGAWK